MSSRSCRSASTDIEGKFILALAVLAEMVPRGGTAIDVGANLEFFAYALSNIADWVLAFEPNPDYAFFARWMLRGRAEVHQLALSDVSGRGTLYVPISDRGMVLHLAGSLKQTHSQYSNLKTYDVEVRTLDEFGLMGVRFIKADVEGREREVLDGARVTIARDRPIILLELLSGTHQDPAADTAEICESFGATPSSSNAGKRSQRCPRLLPSAGIQAGQPRSRVAERTILAAMRAMTAISGSNAPQVPKMRATPYGRPAFSDARETR
jgi:FkbM family methyltransferase